MYCGFTCDMYMAHVMHVMHEHAAKCAETERMNGPRSL